MSPFWLLAGDKDGVLVSMGTRELLIQDAVELLAAGVLHDNEAGRLNSLQSGRTRNPISTALD